MLQHLAPPHHAGHALVWRSLQKCRALIRQDGDRQVADRYYFGSRTRKGSKALVEFEVLSLMDACEDTDVHMHVIEH